MAAARAAAEVKPAVQVSSIATESPKVRSTTTIDAEIDVALLRAERLKKVLPRAATARYDRKARTIVVTFVNGAVFSFPPALVRGFSIATAEQLANISILRGGAELRWDDLDTNLSVSGLLNQIFNTRKVLARIAGQVKSPAKTAVARANGAKGGRPKSIKVKSVRLPKQPKGANSRDKAR